MLELSWHPWQASQIVESTTIRLLLSLISKNIGAQAEFDSQKVLLLLVAYLDYVKDVAVVEY